MTKGWALCRAAATGPPAAPGPRGRAEKPDHADSSLRSPSVFGCSPSVFGCFPSAPPTFVHPSFLCASLLLSGILFSLYLSPSSCLSLPFLFPSCFGLSLISFILPFFFLFACPSFCLSVVWYFPTSHLPGARIVPHPCPAIGGPRLAMMGTATEVAWRLSGVTGPREDPSPHCLRIRTA